MTQPPVLAYADFTKPFIVYTDASNQGLGAVLAQVQDNRERVIAYASRSLHPTEKNDANYSSFKLELLALKWAIAEKFKDYLTGSKFTIYTDNNPVAHLQTARLGAVEQCWVAQLASFDYVVKYRAGRENVNADALSRFPANPSTDAGCEVAQLSAALEMRPGCPPEEPQLCLGEDWKTWQEADPEIQMVSRYVAKKILPDQPARQMLPVKTQKLLQQWGKLQMVDGVLCRRVMDPKTFEACVQVVCPAVKCQQVWKKYHDAAAPAGAERTLSRIRQFFYWPGMDKEVRQFQQGCVACSLRSRVQPKAPLHPFMATYPLEVIGLDFMTLGRATDRVQNILVMIDHFTRYAWAVPTQDQTAETTAHAMWSSVIQVFGCPARFHSDQGANFESSLVQQLCQLYGASKSRTTPYHPAGNGTVERMNQTLLNMLRSLEAERQHRWPEYLPELLAAYNNTVHSSTGYAPSFLMFGRHLRQPVDLSLGVSREPPAYELQGWVMDHQQKLSFAYKLARRNLDKAADRNKQSYDSHANAFPLVPGETVWVRDRNRKGQGKLHPGWDPEPHIVLGQVGDTGVVYRIRPEKGGNEKTMHRNSLKPCIGPMECIEPIGAPTKTEAPSQTPYYFLLNPVVNPPEHPAYLPEPPLYY